MSPAYLLTGERARRVVYPPREGFLGPSWLVLSTDYLIRQKTDRGAINSVTIQTPTLTDPSRSTPPPRSSASNPPGLAEETEPTPAEGKWLRRPERDDQATTPGHGGTPGTRWQASVRLFARHHAPVKQPVSPDGFVRSPL